MLAFVDHGEQVPCPGFGHFQPQANQPDAIEIGEDRQRRTGQFGPQQGIKRNLPQQLGSTGQNHDQQRQFNQLVDLPVQPRQGQFLVPPLPQQGPFKQRLNQHSANPSADSKQVQGLQHG